jgi:hypothetical protein
MMREGCARSMLGRIMAKVADMVARSMRRLLVSLEA